MIGAEGVANVVLAALQPEIDNRLAALRVTLGIEDRELPAIREWRTWTDGRVPEGADTGRMPCIEIAIASDTEATPYALDSGAHGGDLYAYDYAVKVYVVCIGTEWQLAELMRRRYSLAVREAVLALGRASVAVVFNTSGVNTEHFAADAIAIGQVRTESTVSFTVRAFEEVLFTQIGDVATTVVTVIPLP